MLRKRLISAILAAAVGATLLLSGAAAYDFPGGGHTAVIQTTGR